MSVNPFVRDTSRIGGNINTCTRDDAEYFLKSVGIDLDTLLQQALLSNLPPGTVLDNQNDNFTHPHITWGSTRNSGIYLFRPSATELADAIRTGRDLVIVTNEQVILDNYNIDRWESIGDLALIWAQYNNAFDESISSPGIPDWMQLIDITESWAGESSLTEKIIEDGYVHHLGCNEASPYLTQLETD